MANWNEAINIAGLNHLYQTGGIGLKQLAQGVIRKLQNTEAFAASEPELTDVLSAFNAIDDLARVKDYKVAFDMLLEYGDKDHKLWVESEGVNPQEYDDVPKKTRNPFEEDTKPQFSILRPPHYNYGITKGPYAVQNGSEWVNHQFSGESTTTNGPPKSFNGHTEHCSCDACKKSKQEYDDSLPMWDSLKVYEVGEVVRYKNQRFVCIKKHSGIDPNDHSHNRPDDPWKFSAMITSKPFDPSLVFTDRLACVVRGKNYPVGRKHVHMSEDEFNKRLLAANINPPTVPKELYTYWKDCDIPYQDWLIERWNKGSLTYRNAN